jgi:hypothetical protein
MVVTAVIHLVDWGLIDPKKGQYRKSFLRKFVNEGHDIRLLQKQLSLLIGIYELSVA